MRFTSLLSMEVLTKTETFVIIRLQLPVFIWLEHGHADGLDSTVEPVFYVDDQPPVYNATARHLLRGATEAACEEAWDVYQDLLANGIAEPVVRQLLPANLMRWGTLMLTPTELMGLVATHRDSPTKELALLAQGYERVLVDAD